MDFNKRPLFILFQKNQIISHDVGHMKVYDPVHEIKTDEANGKHYSWILVDIRRRHTQKLAYVLKINIPVLIQNLITFPTTKCPISL